MQFKLLGKTFPCVECYMSAGETMYCQNGAMVWMTDTFKLKTSAGGLIGYIKKLITHEDPWQNFYTAKADGHIAFGAGFSGDILAFELDGSQTLMMQKSSFLAAQDTVQLAVAFQKRIKTGLFGGNGFAMQRVTGRGWVFFEVDGSIHEVTLQPGESLLVDTNNLVGYENSVTMDVKMVGGGLKNLILGGEGLFNTKLTGPGKVWLQTMSFRALMSALMTPSAQFV